MKFSPLISSFLQPFKKSTQILIYKKMYKKTRSIKKKVINLQWEINILFLYF